MPDAAAGRQQQLPASRNRLSKKGILDSSLTSRLLGKLAPRADFSHSGKRRVFRPNEITSERASSMLANVHSQL